MNQYIDPQTGLNNIDLILEDARRKKQEIDLEWEDEDDA
jgi:hypothetical protein